MKLWGGRFTKEENQLVHNFNESLSFDQKFYKQDIQGSLAHVKMLGKQGIITTDEMNDIIKGLESIRVDLDNRTLQFDNSEDIHSFVEAHLIERIGDAGKKLHTGRSRNDQVALDMKLYTRHEVEEINDLLKNTSKFFIEGYGGKHRNFYARLYSFTESTAYYFGSSLWCLFRNVQA